MLLDQIYSDEFYAPADIDWILLATLFFDKPKKSNKGIWYWNHSIAFDIETTSFTRLDEDGDDEKCATMYEWTFGIDGYCIVGRTWEEFVSMMDRIVHLLGLHPDNRIVVYVHNLAYEFQWIRKWFDWETVFAIDVRKPLYALTTSGIEFRCSYLLSGYSLAKLGDELRRYKMAKKVGDLDYSLMRHSSTPLTPKELGYCLADVKVVMCYVQECMEDEGGDIFLIPLTKTGYVRRYCRNECLGIGRHRTKDQWRFTAKVKTLQLDPDEYRQLRRGFQGGFTHANPYHSGRLMEDVASFDFTSSYPTVMVADVFPMGRAEYIEQLDRATLEESLDYWCCLFDVYFYNIESDFLNDHYISSSHCSAMEGAQLDNGRVVRADSLLTTITDVDYRIIKRLYHWDLMDVRNFRRYPKGYLPKPFVKSILDLYKAKTELKGVEGMETEYQVAKGMLNSCYGMTVTDIAKDLMVYRDDEWDVDPVDLDAEISRYNRSRTRFLYYPWGVWVTAYARMNLFSGIIECGNDYIYSDTDSIKITNASDHMDYIQRYNDSICSSLEAALDFHGLPKDLYRPMSMDGKEHPLGVWDYEGTYDRFKTLGAKRYLTQTDGRYSLTVAGLGKKVAAEYIADQPDPFDFFSDGMYIPKGYTGKSIHTYIDDETEGTLVDYLGNEGSWHELSSIHMEDSEYELSLSEEYKNLLMETWEVS